jgi:hypothetical protein
MTVVTLVHVMGITLIIVGFKKLSVEYLKDVDQSGVPMLF